MTGAKQLAVLKEAGYRVAVGHLRRFEKLPEGEVRIIPTGGATRVRISCPDNPETIIATGIAYCSNRDNYNRKLGLTIAIGRALKQLEGIGK